MTLRMRLGRLLGLARHGSVGSGEAVESKQEAENAHSGVSGPERSEGPPTRCNVERNEQAEDFVEGKGPGAVQKRAGPGFEVDDFRWDVLHGGVSLRVSAFAGIVLLGANLVEPGVMQTWQVLGGFGVYVGGVLLFFALECRDYRNQRAELPWDRTGGGRLGLVFLAIVFCAAGGERTAGLAGWTAFAALVLGSASDGAWVALVAGRRGLGPFGAWKEIASAEKAARRQCWTALFGEDRR